MLDVETPPDRRSFAHRSRQEHVIADDHTLDFEKILSVLRARALLIVACSVLVAASAYAFSKAQPKEYRASAKLLFREPDLRQITSSIGGVSAAPTNQLRDTNTNVQLITVRGVATRAARALGDGTTADDLIGHIEVTSDGDADIATVTAKSTSPEQAARIANAMSTAFVAQRRETQRALTLKARELLMRRLAEMPAAARNNIEGLTLRDRSESLRIQASLQTGNVELAERAAVPQASSAPKVLQNTALGGLLGLILGVGLAFLLQQLDRRMKEPEDLALAFGLPLLGVVPESGAYSAASSGEGGRLPARESEAFRTLRAHLRYYNVDRSVCTVLVTSAAPGEGKSTVARYLAQAAASMGTRTLLIEADLRRPALSSRLGITPTAGLGDVLIRAVSAADATWTMEAVGETNGATATGGLDVLFAGEPPPNPAELIESQAMQDLLAWSVREYDLVVIDTPPLAVVSDAISLLHRVDGVIIVSRLGASTTTAAERLRERLLTLGAPTLGVVANAYAQSEAGAYDYTYASEVPAPKRPQAPRKVPAKTNDSR